MAKHFGQLLNEHRRRAGWTQGELAELAGIGGHPVVARAEATGEPRLAVARALVQALAAESRLGLEWRELRELAEAYLLTDQQRLNRDDRQVIGLLVPDLDQNLFWAPLVGAIEAAATGSSYQIILYQHRNDINQHYNALLFFETLDALAGVISVPAYGARRHSRKQLVDLAAVLERLRQRGVPAVYVDRRLDDLPVRVPYVGPDNQLAAEKAVAHLIQAGHRRIGGLFGLRHASPQHERFAGYQLALERQGLCLNERLVRFGEATPGPNGPPADDGQGRRPGLRNARELLALPPAERPTAIFCATYYLTLDVVDAVKERQRADAAIYIPGWLSLMGFDKLPMFEHSRPRIAHVYYDLRAIGRQACHKLLDLIENPSDERALTDVVVRAVSVETGGTVARPALDPEIALPALEPALAAG